MQVETRLGFRQQKIRAVIGCYDHERVEEGDLFINIAIDVDVTAAMRSDKLEDTIDYTALVTLCEEVAQVGRYHLLEALAGAIVDAIFQHYPLIHGMEIEIHKPGALPGADHAYIILRRVREVVA